MKLPGARGARDEHAATPVVDRRRDHRRRTGRPSGHQGGRWLLALFATALPLFADAQLLTGPSPWDLAIHAALYGAAWLILLAFVGLLVWLIFRSTGRK